MVPYDSDRAAKYGFGVVRLMLLTTAAFIFVQPRATNSSVGGAWRQPLSDGDLRDATFDTSDNTRKLDALSSSTKNPDISDVYRGARSEELWGVVPSYVGSRIYLVPLYSYWSSYRWVGHVFIGSIGALVNVEALPFAANILLLLMSGAFCLIDVHMYDYSSVVYLVKTFGGDFFAGKLDTAEWKLVLLAVFGLLLPYSLVSQLDHTNDAISAYRRILPVLFAVQFVCEYGDNYLEHWKFFRYRYSFELFTALVLAFLPMTQVELDVVLFDLVICTSYRLSNFAIQVYSGLYASRLLRKLLFDIYGFLVNTRVVNVTDPELAVLVLQRSNTKGSGIERYLASPAWLPAMNVESVDGPVWEGMISNLHVLMKHLPSVAELADTAGRLASEVVAEGTVIDANVIATLTAKMFIEYTFGLRWRPEFDLFVAASWEWRKEIAVKGRADPVVKRRTVELVLRMLRETSNDERSRLSKSAYESRFVRRGDGSAPKDLWAVFGNDWEKPEYFSLVLQPFILSPCINTGDIMVALRLVPVGTSIEAAIRAYHPFPILERFVYTDIEFPVGSGRIAVPARSQVVIMVPDFANCESAWPVFGAGTRSCAGKHLAVAFLRVFQNVLASSPNFKPEIGHKYSGRNNDTALSISELEYFVKRISVVLLQQYVRNRYEKSELDI